MFRTHLSLLAVASFAAGLAFPATDWAAESPDRDSDGISDQHEEILGTDPDHVQRLRVVLEDVAEPAERRNRPEYDATKDFTRIEFCHVGGDRYLWRATLAAAPRLEDTVFHLYVDADADETTGRKVSPGAPNHGTEYMLSVVGGRGTSTHYTADGQPSSGPPVTHVVQGNMLLISADVDLTRDKQGVRYALYVLCHTMTKSGRERPRMNDSSRKQLISGVPVSSQHKIIRPTDYTQNHGVAATHGLHRLQRLLVDPANIAVPHDALNTDGFSVDLFNVRRFPQVRLDKPGGKVWTQAPKAGRFHVGFMMYDDGNSDRVGVYIDGTLHGVAVANQDNNQTWLYWLEQPYAFRGGERVELRALGGTGKHGIVNILFLSNPPEPRDIQYAVKNLVAAHSIDDPHQVTLSWTTTGLCPTRFEFGKNTQYGQVVGSQGVCLAHRVVLKGLTTTVTYHGRAIGTRRDGTTYASGDFVFQAGVVRKPVAKHRVLTVPLTVRNPHTVAASHWPITSGIPIPQGQLDSDRAVRLIDQSDTEVPAQIRVTARWLDQSVKWLLITFAADVSAKSEQRYRLEFGGNVQRGRVEQPVAWRSTKNEGLTVDTGLLAFQVDRHGNVVQISRDHHAVLSEGAACHTRAVDVGGTTYTTEFSDAALTVEETGPIRLVIKTISPLTSSDGQRLFRIEKRIEAYRGSPFLRVYHTLVVDRPDKFTDIESLTYRIPLVSADGVWQEPTGNGTFVRLGSGQSSVQQRFDDEFVMISSGHTVPMKGRGRGAILSRSTSNAACAVAVRDFWQNYPKAFHVGPDGVDVGLCPDFDAGLYDKFPFEKEGHHLYYYLLGGHYRLKRGMAKTHELLVCFARETEQESLCELFQEPLLATAPPAWYCDSKAFYEVAPRDTQRFKLYEEAIDRNLKAYADRRERQHDFGMLNYGDWYGERGSNWGNIEYDTQHAFFLEYIRSGNPDAFFLGEATERHNRDIDTVQWSDKPNEIGAVYVHQMCHVGDYYDKSVPGTLGFPRGGYTVSHAWVEGHFDHYFLTGDRRSYETGCAVADFFVRKELGRPYDFSSTRTPGWHLIMLAAAYHATGDPYYLNAARVVVDRVLDTQDVEPRPLPAYQQQGRQPYQLGGWTRMLVPGHCQCEPRHQGNAGFMIAVLLSGLKYYYDVTGDERVKEAIIRGAHYLLDETYSDEVHGFRYTSCPKTGYRAGSTPLMAEGIARAYLWTHDARFRRVLTEALPLSPGGSTYGKSFSMYYRCGPRVLADLAAAGLGLQQRPKVKE